MNTSGVRIHITGSASRTADRVLLRAAHDFTSAVVSHLIESGAGLVVGFGGEPVGDQGLPCTFDWPILEAIAQAPCPAPGWPAGQPGRFQAIGSQRALDRIPESRRVAWDRCLTRADFELQLSPPGWRMGGVIRAAQVLKGDILLVLGGGAGVEQLAALYSDEGKSVIPIGCELGAFSNDGMGGSSYLHSRALSGPATFFELSDGAGSAVARLAELTIDSRNDPSTTASKVWSLIRDLRPPLAFYIRLLARESDEFEAVEEFFREVVGPVVIEKGMTPYEMGRDSSNAAFMNVEIFERLHRAYLVVADLTGIRPNCMMELGYALARRRRVVISAREGTRLPFDTDKLPTYFWNTTGPTEERQHSFRAWVERHIDMPPVVR